MAAKKEPAPVVPSRRDDLVMMRAKLIAMLDIAEPSVAAQISGQLRQVIKDLSELPDEAVKSDVEKARERRAKRREHLKAV